MVWTFACTPVRNEPVVPASTSKPTTEREESRPSKRARTSKRVLGRPQIDRAHFTSAQELTLHFTEPVAPTTGFDPRQFRLSVGMHYSEIGYSATYYYDVGELAEPEDGAAFSRIEAVDESTLRLMLRAPLPADACEPDLVDHEMGKNEIGGIFLHYDHRDDSAIVDRDGHHLKDIAEAWVLRGADEAMYYGRHAHPPVAIGPIPCDFAAAEPKMPSP